MLFGLQNLLFHVLNNWLQDQLSLIAIMCMIIIAVLHDKDLVIPSIIIGYVTKAETGVL